MQEIDIPAEIGQRLKQDTTGALARVRAYYQQIGQSSRLDDIESLLGPAFIGSGSDFGITLENFTYSTPEIVQTPLVASVRTYQNDGDTVIQDEFAFIKATEEAFTFGFTQGLKVGTKATAKVALPLVGESELELSAEVTFQADQQLTRTQTKTWSLKSTVPVPARSTVKITGFITNAKINAQFSGAAMVTAGMLLTEFKYKGTRGFTSFTVPLVVLLTAEQRTFPLSGSFQGVEGINAYIRVENVAGG